MLLRRQSNLTTCATAPTPPPPTSHRTCAFLSSLGVPCNQLNVPTTLRAYHLCNRPCHIASQETAATPDEVTTADVVALQQSHTIGASIARASSNAIKSVFSGRQPKPSSIPTPRLKGYEPLALVIAM